MIETLEEMNKIEERKKEIQELYTKDPLPTLVLNFTSQHKGHFLFSLVGTKQINNNYILYCNALDPPHRHLKIMDYLNPAGIKPLDVILPFNVSTIEISKSSIGTLHWGREVIILRDKKSGNVEEQILKKKLEDQINLNKHLHATNQNLRKANKLLQNSPETDELTKKFISLANLVKQKDNILEPRERKPDKSDKG